MHQMRMSLNSLIFIFGAIFSVKAELFDVTTIIRYKTLLPRFSEGKNNTLLVDRSQFTITVHARNNALGLPIFLEDGSVISANVGVDIEECSPYLDKCDWQAENMILGINNSAPLSSKVPRKYVFSLVGKEGSLSSPAFVPSYSKICMAVTFYKDDSSTISLELIPSQERKIEFSYAQSIAMNEDWETDIYIAHVPHDVLDSSITVIVKVNMESLVDDGVIIQRIAGCNGRGSEDTIILPEREFQPLPSNGYDVALGDNKYENEFNDGIPAKEVGSDEYKSDYSYNDVEIFTAQPTPESDRIWLGDVLGSQLYGSTRDTGSTSIESPSIVTSDGPVLCVNGGIFVKEHGECLCPAGFVGSTCEKGCGMNKYGAKCDGRCSKTNRGCKAMKLCRPKLGCSCGPGLKGPFCESECDAGRFGIDCQEQCGSCIHGESCDSYTGLCHKGCSDGFFPPYCKERYTYVDEAPQIYHIGFKTINVTVDLKRETIKGRGTPRFYQFQYKTMSDVRWSYLEPQTMVYAFVDAVITGLVPGTTYEIRMVIHDEDGGSYQGHNIPKVEVKTKCSIPSDLQYALQQEYVKQDSFMVFWNYSYKGSSTCQLKYFQVELNEDWSWTPYYERSNTSAHFTGMLPGQDYEVRVRAMTVGEPAAYSNILKVRTEDEVPEAVFDFKLVSTNYNNLKVEWTPPLETAGTIQYYSVSYECRKLLACTHIDCSKSAGIMNVTENFAVIEDLVSHAQYAVSVAAVAATEGPDRQLLAVTDMTEPQVSAKPVSKSAVSHYTNVSFTVRWSPPKDCSHLNGYLQGYRYKLLSEDGSQTIREGVTQMTSASFTNLTPYTEYKLMVYLKTSGGWNPAYPLTIFATTTATVPGPVQQLTVYKRERRLLGLRWALPKEMYGRLKSFTVTCKTKDAKPVKSIVEPAHCEAWPDLYCTTFGSLSDNAEHTVIVQARNEEVDADGEPSVVYAVTKESFPEPPINLRVISQTQKSLKLEWEIPELLNGRLKSFLIAIQQTESFLPSNCCVDFNVREMKASKEQPTYVYEATGLNPASTYSISVSAKTVMLGSSESIRGHTKPPVPSMIGKVAIQGDMSSMSNTPVVKLNPSKENEELIRGYLLIVIPQLPEDDVQSTLWSDLLRVELESFITGSYYIAREFDQAELEENPEVTLGTGPEVKIGKWGKLRDPFLQNGDEYRLGLAIILEYNGVYSVGFTETHVFIIENSSERHHGESVKYEGKHFGKETKSYEHPEKYSDYEYTLKDANSKQYSDFEVDNSKVKKEKDLEQYDDNEEEDVKDYEKRVKKGSDEHDIYEDEEIYKNDVSTEKPATTTESKPRTTSPKSEWEWPW